MSFDIAIKVDPAGAEPAIAKVERALDKAEQAGEKVGKVATKALRETGLAAEQAKAPADNLAKAFGGLNAELQREAAILDRLRGPSLRYNEELRTLDRMLDQNKISVAEYTAELTKMNRALEGAAHASANVKPPDMKKQLGGAAKLAGGLTSGAGGLLGGVEAGLAVGGGLGLAIAAAPVVQKLGEVAMDAADKGLTKLANVLNADFIAARKANEAFIARMQIQRVLIEEEKKTADAIKATQTAGVDLAAVNEDVAMASTRARVAMNAAFGVDLASSMSEAEKKAREFAGALDQLEQSDAAAKLGRDVARAHQSLNGMGITLRGQIDDWKDLATKVEVFKKTLAEINQRRGAAAIGAIFSGVDPTNLGVQTRQDVDITRGLRDATLQLDNVHNVYGKTVVDIKAKTNAHRDAMADLKGAYKAGEISAAEYRRELAALGVQFSKYKALSGVDRNVAALAGPKTRWNPNSGEFDEYTGSLGRSEILEAKGLSEMGLQGSGAMNVPEVTKQYQMLNVEFARTPSLLEDLKAGYADIATTSDILLNAFKGLEDALVSFVTTGKIEFGSLVTSILADLTRMLAQKALMSLFNALMPGPGAGIGNVTAAAGGNFGGIAGALFGGSHAFGGDYRVGGSGGPDSQRVMFNLSPGEHVRFTPPGRDPDAGGSAGSAPMNVRVVNITDPSEMIGMMDSVEGERVIMNAIKRNLPALRGTLTGR